MLVGCLRRQTRDTFLLILLFTSTNWSVLEWVWVWLEKYVDWGIVLVNLLKKLITLGVVLSPAVIICKSRRNCYTVAKNWFDPKRYIFSIRRSTERDDKESMSHKIILAISVNLLNLHHNKHLFIVCNLKGNLFRKDLVPTRYFLSWL